MKKFYLTFLFISLVATAQTGIGTTTPAYKLDVIGTIRSREVKVDMNGADFQWADAGDVKKLQLH